MAAPYHRNGTEARKQSEIGKWQGRVKQIDVPGLVTATAHSAFVAFRLHNMQVGKTILILKSEFCTGTKRHVFCRLNPEAFLLLFPFSTSKTKK